MRKLIQARLSLEFRKPRNYVTEQNVFISVFLIGFMGNSLDNVTGAPPTNHPSIYIN